MKTYRNRGGGPIKIVMADDWKDYQEETAAFFRGIGFEAETDARVEGVRTHHDVDVVVRSHHLGLDVLWLVECKHWRTRISKLHVLALREIVADVGADRGIILSEVGFQRGALEAATLTNVRPTSLAALRRTASSEILAVRLRELYDRTEVCNERYWEIPKQDRIRLGLRPDFLESGYSGTDVVGIAQELLFKAMRGVYPIESESNYAFRTGDGPLTFATGEEILAFLEPMVADLEKRLPEKI